MPGRLLQPENAIWSAHGYRKPKRPVLNNNHPINAGLVGCWLLNDFTTGLVNDLSLSRNNGQVIGGTLARQHFTAPQQAYGPRGGIVSAFYGPESPYSENRVEVPNSASIDITSSLTIMCWQCPEHTFTAARVMSKLSQPPYNGYELFNQNSNGKVGFQTGAGGSLQLVYSTTNFVNGTWLFSAATYDGATGTIYSNGVAENTFSGSNAVGHTASNLSFASWASAGGGFNMSGYMDGVRVYNRVLSPAEIWQLYIEPYAGIWDAQIVNRFGVASPPPSSNVFSYSEIWG